MTLTIRSSWATQLAQTITQALDEVKVEKPCLFIEGLDFLLAAGEDFITPNEILTLLSSLTEVPPINVNSENSEHHGYLPHFLRTMLCWILQKQILCPKISRSF